MKKILFICQNPTEANAYYRSSGISHSLSKISGSEITIINWTQNVIDWSVILQYDIIFFQRPFTREALTLCSYVKACGKSLWVDYDDNLLNVSPENKYYMMYSKQETKDNIRKMITMSDAVSVSSLGIKQAFEYNGLSVNNVFVVPNALDDALLKSRKVWTRNNRVLWRGSDSHIFNLWLYGKEINELIDKHPDFEFDFMGYYPWFLSEKKGYIEPADTIYYFHKIQTIAPKVVHAPISFDAFNSCRSEIAFIEATYAGAVTVCPFHWDIQGGIKYKDPSSYFDRMDECLSGNLDFEKQLKISWEYILDCRLLSKVNEKRKIIIDNLS